MTAIRDPYPEELLAEIPDTAADPLVNAITRLAQAVEANTAALTRQNAPQASLPAYVPPAATPAPLAALPPVQQAPVTVVPTAPQCPFHPGINSMRSSTKPGIAFYCSAKASPGQPSNPRGYCTFSVPA